MKQLHRLDFSRFPQNWRFKELVPFKWMKFELNMQLELDLELLKVESTFCAVRFGLNCTSFQNCNVICNSGPHLWFYSISEIASMFNNVLDAWIGNYTQNSPCTSRFWLYWILRTQAALKRQLFSRKSSYNNVTRWPGKDANYKFTN